MTNQSVLGEVKRACAAHALLITGAAMIGLVVGVTIGVISAVKRRSAGIDRAMGSC